MSIGEEIQIKDIAHVFNKTIEETYPILRKLCLLRCTRHREQEIDQNGKETIRDIQ